ncbi:MAG: tetratricopeptide repeat protein [Candidatus Lokiarchaeota archaeon]|nr:tetratricopeptide repeat protein [Candidatus Lokiarchaeota archaeon]
MMIEEKYSPKIFIGRKKEIELFEKMLEDENSVKWILNIHGPGGLGKTQLMEQYIKITKDRRKNGENILFIEIPIDLYWTEHQRELGILKSISDQLKVDNFISFDNSLKKYTKLLEQEEELPASALQDRERELVELFIEKYKSIKAKRIVLFFDTAELVSDAVLRFWEKILTRLQEAQTKTLAIIAGREPVKITPKEIVEPLFLDELSVDEVDEYFKSQGFELSEIEVSKIAKLSKGRPIFIALTIDWLRYGNTIQELIADHTPEQFERFMVERVQKLHYPEDHAILAMAHFYRRFNDEILKLLLDQRNINPHGVMRKLSEFSFVKYRPPIEGQLCSCTLHDEMRDLVNKYAWPIAEPLGELRHEWEERIIEYYGRKIDQTKQDPIERQNLSQERLFYCLNVNLKQAFDYSKHLFKQATDKYDTNFMEAINKEIAEKENELTPSMQREYEFRKAIIAHRRERYNEAIAIINRLIENPACEEELRVEAITRLIVLYTDSGKAQNAIKIGKNLEKELDKQFAGITHIEEERKPLKLLFGRLCNNIGFAYRSQNKYYETINYYRKALKHYQDVGEEAYSRIARTWNNIGYVYNRLGHNEEALSQCSIALKLRERIKSAYELGLSYNVLGIIYTDLLRAPEAEKYFKRALDAFAKAESRRGKALTCVAYGRLMRQWGHYKDSLVGEPFDRNREEYKKASQMLDEAIEIFQLLANPPNLLEAFNEKATLLRQQRKLKEAITFYQESLEIAKSIGDLQKQIDNLQDLGILYLEYGDLDKSLMHSKNASKMALNNEYYYLYARSQMTIFKVYFAKKKYDKAFVYAANACIYILRPDPYEMGHTSAKKNLVYDQFVYWTSERILQLPTHELVKQKCNYLIDCWNTAEVDGKKLSESYPGFIEKMEALSRDYPFLKEETENE